MNIRPALRTDMQDLVELMIEFARYDGSEGEIKLDRDRLEEVLFTDDPKLYTIVIEESNKAIAFLNYYFSYSSFELKKCLWVEDVFVAEHARRKGFGDALFDYVRKVAKENDCIRVEWLVRKDNQLGIDFYNKLGASVDDDTIYVKWKL